MEADSSRGTVVWTKPQNIYHEWGGNGNRGQAREIHPHDHWYQLMTYKTSFSQVHLRSLDHLAYFVSFSHNKRRGQRGNGNRMVPCGGSHKCRLNRSVLIAKIGQILADKHCGRTENRNPLF